MTPMDLADRPKLEIIGSAEGDTEASHCQSATNNDHSPDSKDASCHCASDHEVSKSFESVVCYGESFLFGEKATSPPPDDIPKTVVQPSQLLSMIFGCAKWSKQRLQSTALGLFSSIMVLVVRLLLDIEPTAYLIHSIVVFLDMALIHLFTNSVWLSVSGELVTMLMVLAFHFTKETVWELLETTLLAILCSFHLIHSRNKHMDKEKELRNDLKTFCRQTSDYLSHIDDMESATGNYADDVNSSLTQRHSSRRTLEHMRSTMIDWNSDRSVEFDPEHNDHVGDLERRVYTEKGEKVKVWGEQFFLHFLDGSAGVMYTSFFGLILDELIRLNDDINCKK